MMSQHLAHRELLLKPKHPNKCSDLQQILTSSKYLDNIEKIARKYTKGTTTAWEDAAQAAHEKVCKALQAGKFRTGGVEEFYYWAAKVARFEIIKYLRQKKQHEWQSLDQTIPGTDMTLIETIAWDFNLLDALEKKDLLVKAIEAIAILERNYPHRGYLKLWQGLIEGKKQTQLAAELGITQGAVSKRWHEFCSRLSQLLG